jgi:RNA polymerase sigma-70 factor, ECF subfamily
VSDAAAMNRFLSGVEKKAFHMANLSVKDQDEAMDIVQDSMMTLAVKYSSKREDEWSPLFYRILRNRITDFHRRRIIRDRIMGFFSASVDEDDSRDPIQHAPDGHAVEPTFQVQMRSTTEKLSRAIGALPRRQQEAFLLRAWEGLSVEDTATAMRCSGGSVKTHYSRAVHALREVLEDDYEQ